MTSAVKPHALELLAPAGGPDAGYAAFHYGADAIYCGLKKFSARAEAENFTPDELDEITAYAHSLSPRRRVFVTLNTLVLQRELPEVIEQIGLLSDLAVDGLIVQDLGVAWIVRRHFPGLRLHASTQMAIHNRAGAEVLKELGFARVVLARELTLSEIQAVCALKTLEVEVFVHGAMCYGYSGLCLFSSQTLGRSGNRGRCAYPCRDYFEVCGRPAGAPPSGYAFSLKDLALADWLPGLQAAGVASLKIEGRKKSPLYVATTTAYYRDLLEGRLPAGERAAREAELKTVFSRPWSQAYLAGQSASGLCDRDWVGHRGHPIGRVEELCAPDEARLRFTTSRQLEIHDGLQVDVPGLGKPFGFAVDDLRLFHGPRGAPVFEAPAGATVEVGLPPEHPALPPGAVVYCSSAQDVKRRYRFPRPKAGQFRLRRPIEVILALSAGELAGQATVDGIEAESRLAGPFAPAKDLAGMAAAARGAFEKLGDTPWQLHKLTWLNPAGCFVPVSKLNALRRELTGALAAQSDRARAGRIEKVQQAVCPEAVRGPVPRESARPLPFQWCVRVQRGLWLDEFEAEDWAGCAEVEVELGGEPLAELLDSVSRLAERAGAGRIRLALPALTRGWEEDDLNQKLEALRARSFTRYTAANLSAWHFLKAREPALDWACDWTVHVLNRAAAVQALELGAHRFTLSPEDGLENMRTLLNEFGARAVVIVYQDTPLFISESCAYANLRGACPGPGSCEFESMPLRSSFGQTVIALKSHCRTVVINQSPFCLAGRLKPLAAAGAQTLRADFSYRCYDARTVRAIWRRLRAGLAEAGGQAANFDRGLQGGKGDWLRFAAVCKTVPVPFPADFLHGLLTITTEPS